MRIRRIITKLIILLFTAGMSYISISYPYPRTDTPAPADTVAVELPLPPLAPSPEPFPELDIIYPERIRNDAQTTLFVLIGDEIREMSMEDYLFGAVAAEIPASYEREALKAQAVAARTNVLHSARVQPKYRHPLATVCVEYSCCTVYYDDDQLREMWGVNYNVFILRIINAVIETDGVYLSYDNQPILAVFHSSSSGMTEAGANVWVDDLPYLQSVQSPETEDLVPDFAMTVTVPFSDFKDTVTGRFPAAAFGDDPMTWVTDIEHTESGRIYGLSIGGAAVRGTTLRSLFGLRSTLIDIEAGDGFIAFTTLGYGHGVGMSQDGANIMAARGYSYEDILLAYYSNVTLNTS